MQGGPQVGHRPSPSAGAAVEDATPGRRSQQLSCSGGRKPRIRASAGLAPPQAGPGLWAHLSLLPVASHVGKGPPVCSGASS